MPVPSPSLVEGPTAHHPDDDDEDAREPGPVTGSLGVLEVQPQGLPPSEGFDLESNSTTDTEVSTPGRREHQTGMSQAALHVEALPMSAWQENGQDPELWGLPPPQAPPDPAQGGTPRPSKNSPLRGLSPRKDPDYSGFVVPAPINWSVLSPREDPVLLQCEEVTSHVPSQLGGKLRTHLASSSNSPERQDTGEIILGVNTGFQQAPAVVSQRFLPRREPYGGANSGDKSSVTTSGLAHDASAHPGGGVYEDYERSDTDLTSSSNTDGGDSGALDFGTYVPRQPPPPPIKDFPGYGAVPGHAVALQLNSAGAASEELPPEDSEQVMPSCHLDRRSCFESLVKRGPARCPCCFSVFWLGVSLVTVAMGMVIFPPNVESDFGNFMKTDSPSSNMWDSFEAAKAARDDEGRRLQLDMYSFMELLLFYETTDGSSIMSASAVGKIQAFEARVRSLPLWRELCSEAVDSERQLCDPGISYVNYLRPTLLMGPEASIEDIVPSSMRLDGLGREATPEESAVRLVESQVRHEVIFPRNYDLSNYEAVPPSVLRTYFRFKIFCCLMTDPASVVEASNSAYQARWDAIVGEGGLLETLQTGIDDSVRVYFAGNALDELQVMQALQGDLLWAMGSMFFVLFYLIMHTRSFFLGSVSLLTVVLAVPVAYVWFAILAGTTKMSIASMLSLFLIVGLGSDVVFVFTDFWRDSKDQFDSDERRLAWTYSHAGKATLVTSFTTALSFFANIASVLKPLREFGYFMGLCVMFTWVLVLLIYAPLCSVQESWAHDAKCWSCAERNDSGKSGGKRSKSKGKSVMLSLFRSAVKYAAKIQGLWSKWSGPYVVMVYRLRFVLTLGCTAIVFAELISTVQNTEVDTSMPNLFPEEHNLNRGKVVQQLFAPIDDVVDFTGGVASAPMEVEVCKEYVFRNNDDQCPLFWCETAFELSAAQGNECTCTRRSVPTSSCDSRNWIRLSLRIAGYGLVQGQLRSAVVDYWGRSAGDATLQYNSDPRVRDMPKLLLQEWEAGTTSFVDMYEVTAQVRRDSLPSSRRCGWTDVCFCGVVPCFVQDGWEVLDTRLVLPGERLLVEAAPLPALHPWPRALQSDDVLASNKMADVVVAVGLVVSESAPLLGSQEEGELWTFKEGFNPSQPWAQRNLYGICAGLADDLFVMYSACWVKDFRDYVVARGHRYPLQPSVFDEHILDFSTNAIVGEPPMTLLSPSAYLWFRDDRLKAGSFTFKVNVHKDSTPAEEVMKYKTSWDDYIAAWNSEATPSATGAFHISWQWVKAEAAKELVSSTFTTLVVLMVLAFGSMLLFTSDLTLSILVVSLTLGVVIGVAFFMLVLLGWALGPIEVIALIVFIGYAVTYSLHVAHKYGHSGECRTPRARTDRLKLSSKATARFKLADNAVRSMGGAALGSAATTAGCALFLLPCQLTIFSKLGLVVLAISFMSISTALAPLPAALFIMGPVHPGRCRRLRALMEGDMFPSMVFGGKPADGTDSTPPAIIEAQFDASDNAGNHAPEKQVVTEAVFSMPEPPLPELPRGPTVPAGSPEARFPAPDWMPSQPSPEARPGLGQAPRSLKEHIGSWEQANPGGDLPPEDGGSSSEASSPPSTSFSTAKASTDTSPSRMHSDKGDKSAVVETASSLEARIKSKGSVSFNLMIEEINTP